MWWPAIPAGYTIASRQSPELGNDELLQASPGSTAGSSLPTEIRELLGNLGRSGGPLHSQAVITDGLWHRVGLVWDGSYRFLYVDDIETARDTNQLGQLIGSDGAIYLGSGKNLQTCSFFSGMIDDFKIYDRVVTP